VRLVTRGAAYVTAAIPPVHYDHTWNRQLKNRFSRQEFSAQAAPKPFSFRHRPLDRADRICGREVFAVNLETRTRRQCFSAFGSENLPRIGEAWGSMRGGFEYLSQFVIRL
jgi:hypothetical protein